jgi:hypothetical protein
VNSDGLAFGQYGLPLILAEAAPNPVLLPDSEGVVETVALDPAGHADCLGPFLTLALLVLPLKMSRRKEDDRLRSAARSPDLPHIVS